MAAVNSSVPRELTHDEKAAIRKLVTSACANYDHEYDCLPLDCACYMLGKCWTGSYCKYFRRAVLPVDLALEAALTGEAVATRPCGVCGRRFPVSGKRLYCSAACAGRARNNRQRGYMRKRRGII